MLRLGATVAGKSSGPNLFGNWPIVAAILVIGTYFIHSNNLPFQGSRPAASSEARYGLSDAQDVDARLWQDPFDAIWKDVDRRAKDKLPPPCKGDAVECSGLANEKSVILGVLLPGSPYPEQEELRRQIRYAVLSSLNAGTSNDNYDPRDEQHIGYAPYPVSVPPACETAPEIPATATNFAFEEFTPRKATAAGDLLVLWINEDEFAGGAGNCLIGALSELKRTLLRKTKPGSQAVFLGPAASTTLRKMVAEARMADCNAAKPGDLTLYNFLATAEEKTLLDGTACHYPDLATYFKRAGLTYYRTVAQDSKLAEALVGELKKRRVSPCETENRVLLVSEWDTFYGRTFPQTLKEAFGCDAGVSATRFPAVSYMRGLDGQLAEQAAGSGGSAPQQKQDGAAGQQQSGTEQVLNLLTPSPSIERPYGNGQFDYLRRLGIDLEAANEKISAIGVVGTDIYDKLIVLQQLRPQFPNAVFFTTDLDARLLHPAEAEWTRGLIVASAYGLEARPELQGGIPPFRSSYQTSAFLTARLALEDLASPGPQVPLRWLDRPALFQIPYHRLVAYPLQVSTDPAPCPSLRACNTVSPLVPALFPRAPAGYATIAAGSALLSTVLFGIGFAFSGTVRGLVTGAPVNQTHSPWPMLSLAFVLVVIPGVFLVLNAGHYLLHQPLALLGATSLAAAGIAFRIVERERAKPSAGKSQAGLVVILFLLGGFLYFAAWPSIGATFTWWGEGEPILLLSGISLWPSLAIRCVAVALSVWLTSVSIRTLDRNLQSLQHRFGFEDADGQRTVRLDGIFDACGEIRSGLRSMKERLKADAGNRRQNIIRHVLDSFSYRLEASPKDMGEFWRSYRRKGVAPARFCRITMALALVLSLELLLLAAFGYSQPTNRGAWLHAFDWFVLFLESITIWFLILYVVDATLFCVRFVTQLDDFHPQWETAKLRDFKDMPPVPAEFLSEWIDLQFVGERTSCINKLVYFPFLVLGFLIFARSRMLDDFPLNWPVLIMIGLGFLAVFGCAVALPIVAERFRQTRLRRLSNRLIAIKGQQAREVSPEQIEMVIKKIEDFHAGAFRPITQQPVATALLLPLSGIGGTALLQYFALPGL